MGTGSNRWAVEQLFSSFGMMACVFNATCSTRKIALIHTVKVAPIAKAPPHHFQQRIGLQEARSTEQKQKKNTKVNRRKRNALHFFWLYNKLRKIKKKLGHIKFRFGIILSDNGCHVQA